MNDLKVEIGKAALRRRSIRKYEERAIPEEDLRELLLLAGRAPSAWNAQPWKFVVVREAELKQKLMAVAYNQAQVGAAAAVIVMYTDMLPALERASERTRGNFSAMSEAEREQWGMGQGYIALGYLLLLAEAFGLASSPMLGFQPDGVKELLGLPGHVKLPAIVALGYAAEEGKASTRLGLEETVSWR